MLTAWENNDDGLDPSDYLDFDFCCEPVHYYCEPVHHHREPVHHCYSGRRLSDDPSAWNYESRDTQATVLRRPEPPVVRARTPPIRNRGEVAIADTRTEEDFSWVGGSAISARSASTVIVRGVDFQTDQVGGMEVERVSEAMVSESRDFGVFPLSGGRKAQEDEVEGTTEVDEAAEKVATGGEVRNEVNGTRDLTGKNVSGVGKDTMLETKENNDASALVAQGHGSQSKSKVRKIWRRFWFQKKKKP